MGSKIRSMNLGGAQEEDVNGRMRRLRKDSGVLSEELDESQNDPERMTTRKCTTNLSTMLCSTE